MMRLNKILLLIFLFVIGIPGIGFTLENYPLLEKGKIAKDEGRTEDAIYYYKRYIASHPTVIGVNSTRYISNRQYYIRNLLIAYTGLIDSYRKQNDTLEIEKCLAALKEIESTGALRAKNRYRVAMLFHDYKFYDDAVSIYKQILDELINNYSPINNKVALRALSRLLKVYHLKGENNQIQSIIGSVKSGDVLAEFDFRDRYKFAVLCLEYGFHFDGLQLLEQIIDELFASADLSEINTIVKAYLKLLKIYHEKNADEKSRILVSRFCVKYPDHELSSTNFRTLDLENGLFYFHC